MKVEYCGKRPLSENERNVFDVEAGHLHLDIVNISSYFPHRHLNTDYFVDHWMIEAAFQDQDYSRPLKSWIDRFCLGYGEFWGGDIDRMPFIVLCGPCGRGGFGQTYPCYMKRGSSVNDVLDDLVMSLELRRLVIQSCL